MTAVARRARGLVVVLALLVVGASPASATPETLRRAFSNLLMSPLDIATSPIVGTQTVYDNIRYIDDTMGVRIFYVLPGVAWNIGVQIGAGGIRALTGALEILPGLAVFFLEADLDPLFAPPEKADALVDVDTPPLAIKFGINYVD